MTCSHSNATHATPYEEVAKIVVVAAEICGNSWPQAIEPHRPCAQKILIRYLEIINKAKMLKIEIRDSHGKFSGFI